MRNKKRCIWLAVPILAVIVLAVHLSQHPLFQTFRCEGAATANRIVLLDQGTELELSREEDAGLFERVLHALFDVRCRRSGRSDNATRIAVRLSILDAAGTVLWERFVLGDQVVDRGYFYRRTGGEESLDDLIAQIKARGAET